MAFYISTQEDLEEIYFTHPLDSNNNIGSESKVLFEFISINPQKISNLELKIRIVKSRSIRAIFKESGGPNFFRSISTEIKQGDIISITLNILSPLKMNEFSFNSTIFFIFYYKMNGSDKFNELGYLTSSCYSKRL
jgi:hypothetical protein|tara:strand:- start:3734 stop:4141 length:408 start_codon:yes stop_codon:yes gene_type:complete